MEAAMVLPRSRLVEFLIVSSQKLRVSSVVKYTSLALFADRFLPALSRRNRKSPDRCRSQCWLLRSLTESNLQLFALVSIWISSKFHDTRPTSAEALKSVGDELVKGQHFTARDYVDAEIAFMEVLEFEIGALNLTYVFLEELLTQFRELSRVGDLLSLPACLDIMDLLYETEDTSSLFQSPYFLAASILAASYVLTVPVRRCEFPLLPWLKVVTSFEETDVRRNVEIILRHVFEPGQYELISRRLSQ